MTIVNAAKWILKNNGIKGFYRGITPRIGLGIIEIIKAYGKLFVWYMVAIR